jgi:hypothetical protein
MSPEDQGIATEHFLSQVLETGIGGQAPLVLHAFIRFTVFAGLHRMFGHLHNFRVGPCRSRKDRTDYLIGSALPVGAGHEPQNLMCHRSPPLKIIPCVTLRRSKNAFNTAVSKRNKTRPSVIGPNALRHLRQRPNTNR